MVKLKEAYMLLSIICLVGILSACSGGSSSSSSSSNNNLGTIALFPSGPIQVTNGSIQLLQLSLSNVAVTSGQKVSAAITPVKVSVSVSNSSIANVYVQNGKNGAYVLNAPCVITSSQSYCTVRIDGLSLGSTSLIASAPGYPTLTVSTISQANSVYGFLAAEKTPGGKWESMSPLVTSYSTAGSSPYNISVTGVLVGSSGIVESTNAIINIAPASSGANQCSSITTINPTCTLTFQTSLQSESFVISMAGGIVSQVPTGYYKAFVVNAVGDNTPKSGVISLSSQNNNIVPLGMKGPVFVNWSDVSIPGTVNLTLTSGNPGVIKFYQYESGSLVASESTSCSLRSSAVESIAVLSCGSGVYSIGAGTSVISATITSTSFASGTFTISPITLSVESALPAIRTITFTNNSKTKAIYVGITGGSATAYTDSSTPAITPGAVTANEKPGAGSMCGPSNPKSACPVGSTCLQGGANPSSTSVYFCYWDQPTPAPGYLIESNGGSTTLTISGSSFAPNSSNVGGIIWSGNYYARTNCNPATGVCENADCHGINGGLQCGPGTGASPGVNTLAELTFQTYAPDFYDVSIINGVNFAAQFGPESSSSLIQSTGNAYNCGVAGSLESQLTWTPPALNGPGLPAASWVMRPSESSFPSESSMPNPTIYYRWVNNDTMTPCTNDTTCTNINAAYRCGYLINTTYNNAESAINLGNNSSYTQVCGTPEAWLTADSIFGLNESANNVAPFNFFASWPNPVTPASPVTVGDLQLCINNTFSSYITNPGGAAGSTSLACGGVSWQSYQGGITSPTGPVITANLNWVSNVLPTITWLKQGCPTCYTYPFDDFSSTFTCQPTNSNNSNSTYVVNFSDLK